MIIEIIETIDTVLEVMESVTVLEIADFDTGVGCVPLSVVEAKGDLIVGTAAGQVVRFAAGSAGQSVIYDPTTTSGLGYGSAGQAANATMTNKSGGAANAGDVLIFSSEYDSAFISTTIESDLRVCGVAGEYIDDDGEGAVNSVPGIICAVNCDSGAVSRGDWLISSSTEFKAKSGGILKPSGAFAIALSAKDAGAAGQVQAMMVQGFTRGVSGTSGWAVGGNAGSGGVTNSEKFTIAAGTWATIAGAALPTGTYGAGGIGRDTTAGYSLGGYQSGYVATAYKLTYTIDTTAACATANLSLARAYPTAGGLNGQLKGYVGGGTDVTVRQTSEVLTFATEITAAISNLPSARYFTVGVSDGVHGYVLGGFDGAAHTGICSRITFSTDAVADHNDGDVTASQLYTSINFQAVAGYLASKAGAAVPSHKIVFATGISAAVSSTLPADQGHAFGVSDGLSLGWICGDDASPYTAGTSFNQTTETYAVDADAALAYGKNQGAYFNNGSY